MISPALAHTVAIVAHARATARAAGHGWPARRRMPRQQYPKLVEVEYGKMLRAQLGAVHNAVLGIMHTLTTGALEDATKAIDELRARFASHAPGLAHRLATVAVRVLDHQAAQLDRQTQAVLGVPAALLGVTMHAIVPTTLRTDARGTPSEADRVTGWIGENVSLIKSLGDTPLAQVEQAVARAYAAGDRHETLAREIAGRFGVAEDRAAVIARDQIGKLNGRVSADRHQRMGLTRFVWRDVGDSRVRPEHRHLSGTVWAYAQPPSEGLPGEPIQCRCHDEPIFDDVLAELDRLEAEGTPFLPAPELPPAAAPLPEPVVQAPRTPDLTPRLATEVPEGWLVPDGKRLVEGLPPRAALRAREVYLIPADQLEGRLIALPGGGKDQVRLASVASAQAKGRLGPVKLSMLPDGSLFVEDGRHRLINAIRAGRPVVAQIGKASANTAVGTVRLVT